jgi:carboxyl-terminal processing protease
MQNKNLKSKAGWIAAAAVLLVSVSFATLSDREFQVVKNLDIFFNLFRELSVYYVDETDPEKLINESIDGMLETLDPYTSFIPESQMEDYKTTTTGQYGGIGASIRNVGNAVTVVELSRNNPADRAGLRVGDMLMKIDGQWLTGKSVAEVTDMLTGAPNTRVELTYMQADTRKEVVKPLVRETMTIPNVPYYGPLEGAHKTGYIRLSGFSANAGKDVKDALTALKKSHNIESLILDLRNNPGGLLVEAVDVVNLFVKRGQEVVSTRGRVKQWDNIFVTRHEPVDTVIPLVVVVNRMSASASEIVAGAIQDLDRGIIVGQRTFGKGLVQATRPLSYNAQLKITTAKYYIPSGRCIQALDYTHREADGSVGYVPDSLIREYKTLKNHRTVRDGGGVSPDVEINPETLSRIAVTLYLRNLFFNYATIYAQKHDSIASAGKFKLTAQEYDEYVAYLKNQSFDYQSESEITFHKLKEIAIREKYMDDAQAEFNALQAKLSHDRYKDLEIFKEEVKELLEEEIVLRYYYNAGRIANTLQHDTQIKEAATTVNAQDRYRALLGGKSL